MSITIEKQQADLTDLARAHNTFTSANELGADASTEAPASTPLCLGVIIGVSIGTTVASGC